MIGEIFAPERGVAAPFHKNVAFKFFPFLLAMHIHARWEGVVRTEQTQPGGRGDGFHGGGSDARGIGVITRHHRVGFNII